MPRTTKSDASGKQLLSAFLHLALLVWAGYIILMTKDLRLITLIINAILIFFSGFILLRLSDRNINE